jgi:hypothetical protein
MELKNITTMFLRNWLMSSAITVSSFTHSAASAYFLYSIYYTVYYSVYSIVRYLFYSVYI